MLKTTRKSCEGNKCSATSISWAKLHWKPYQLNVKSYFNFNPKPKVGGSRVTVSHYGWPGTMGKLDHKLKNDKISPSESFLAKCFIYFPYWS